jgi:hypothetical protein
MQLQISRCSSLHLQLLCNWIAQLFTPFKCDLLHWSSKTHHTPSTATIYTGGVRLVDVTVGAVGFGVGTVVGTVGV